MNAAKHSTPDRQFLIYSLYNSGCKCWKFEVHTRLHGVLMQDRLSNPNVFAATYFISLNVRFAIKPKIFVVLFSLFLDFNPPSVPPSPDSQFSFPGHFLSFFFFIYRKNNMLTVYMSFFLSAIFGTKIELPLVCHQLGHGNPSRGYRNDIVCFLFLHLLCCC